MNKTAHAIYVGSFFAVGISVTILLAVNGYNYYSTPLEERFFQSQHSALKPSGIYGHGLGIIGTFMMILGVAVYMIRKRTRALFNFGYLKHWLEFHIFLCSLGPVLVLFHTSFKFGGIVSVSFWSMAAVVASGIIGRFIYVQIPRTIQGKEIDVKELNSQLDNITYAISNKGNIGGSVTAKIDEYSSGAKYRNVKFSSSLFFLLKDYFTLNLVVRKIKKELSSAGFSKAELKELTKAVKNKLLLSRRIGLLRTTQKLFKYWHVAHLPFAITMFVIMLVHVAVTILFGYKWIF
jgi:hypothetical protein